MMQPDSTGNTFSVKDIAATYHLEEDDFVALIRLPAFVAIMRSELARIKELGPFAGQRLRAEALATDLQEHLYSRAKSGIMDDKQAVALLGILLKSAGLDMPPDVREQETNKASASVNIAFNLPKLPHNKKLAHLMGMPQTISV